MRFLHVASLQLLVGQREVGLAADGLFNEALALLLLPQIIRPGQHHRRGFFLFPGKFLNLLQVARSNVDSDSHTSAKKYDANEIGGNLHFPVLRAPTNASASVDH